MQPKKPNTTIFSVLILITLLIIVVIVTLIYQNKNKPLGNISTNPPSEQYPMVIIKPKNNQTVTTPTNIEARVKAPFKTQDLGATAVIDGQTVENLRVRKTKTGDIFLAGTLSKLTPGTHSIGLNLYSLNGSSKSLISNAQYRIIVP